MPTAPTVLVIGGKPARSEGRRANSHQRGYTRQWANASKRFLKSHPFCVECNKNGQATPSTETDHVIPHRGNMALFWDPNNWQALCHSCHSKKTLAGL